MKYFAKPTYKRQTHIGMESETAVHTDLLDLLQSLFQ